MNNKKQIAMLAIMKEDVQAAKRKKVTIDDEITEWLDIYNGEEYNYIPPAVQSAETRSTFVSKEVKKLVERQKPNITEAFLGKQGYVDINEAPEIEDWINEVLVQEGLYHNVVEDAVHTLLTEGTTWVRTGWDRRSKKTKQKMGGLSQEEALTVDPTGKKTKREALGTFEVSFINEKVTKNDPTIIVCRNEHVLPDPSAKSKKDLRFLAWKRVMTEDEILRIPGIKKDALKDEPQATMDQTSSLEIKRELQNMGDESLSFYQPEDNGRKKYNVIEYWGTMELDTEIGAEPILAYWIDNSDTAEPLLIVESPIPSGEIPFFSSYYTKESHSLWGKAVAAIAEDGQKILSGIMRGAIDNMTEANIGQTFVERGTLSHINMKKMQGGARLVTVNKKNGIERSTYNPIPQSIFGIYNMTSKENEELVGIEGGGASALTAKNSGTSNSENMMTLSQIKMLSTVRIIEMMFNQVFAEWITMAADFLEPKEIQAMFKQEQEIDLGIFENLKKGKIKIDSATQFAQNIRINQTNMMLQQVGSGGNDVPPTVKKALIADLFQSLGRKKEAAETRNYVYQPSEEESRMQQMMMQEKELDIKEKAGKIANDKARVQAELITAEAKMVEARAVREVQSDKNNMDNVNSAVKNELEAKKIEMMREKKTKDTILEKGRSASRTTVGRK